VEYLKREIILLLFSGAMEIPRDFVCLVVLVRCLLSDKRAPLFWITKRGNTMKAQVPEFFKCPACNIKIAVGPIISYYFAAIGSKTSAAKKKASKANAKLSWKNHTKIKEKK
jgi:hypothetical protein